MIFASCKERYVMKEKDIHPLTRWRFENGQMSLAALGKKVKASAPHLSDIENRTKNPSVHLLSRIARVTKLKMVEIAPSLERTREQLEQIARAS